MLHQINIDQRDSRRDSQRNQNPKFMKRCLGLIVEKDDEYILESDDIFVKHSEFET